MSIYLSSLQNIKLLPDNCKKVFIARVPIKNMDKYNFIHIDKLAPSSQLLYDYKQGKIFWSEYVKRYRREMLNMTEVLDFIYNQSFKENIALICYCNNKQCHRFILGHYFEELGCTVCHI